MPHPLPTIFPIGLILEGRRCLVVGAGPMADQKVRGLRSAGALVTVVAPSVCTALRERAASDDGIELVERAYRPADLDGVWLVVAATDIPEVDGGVAADAEDQQIFVNAVDDPPNCSAYLMAQVRRGPVVVSISTSGASPAMASFLRRRLDAALEPALGEVALLLSGVRGELAAQGRTTEGLPWATVIDDDLIADVAAGAHDRATQRIRAAVGGAER
jgi:siroheme synthase-like protein